MKRVDLDDGKYFWRHHCIYVDETTNPYHWYYEITFENKQGEGYLSGSEISCRYFESRNMLRIVINGTRTEFNVKNFKEVYQIIKLLVKGDIYPLYNSLKGKLMKERKTKINKINGKKI